MSTTIESPQSPSPAPPPQSPPHVSVSKTDDDDRVENSIPEDEARTDCEENRERLKRQRTEVAGRVWIPDIWGQEDLLKDWIDCSVFDTTLAPKGLMSAREALVEEGRRATTSSGVEVGNSC